MLLTRTRTVSSLIHSIVPCTPGTFSASPNTPLHPPALKVQTHETVLPLNWFTSLVSNLVVFGFLFRPLPEPPPMVARSARGIQRYMFVIHAGVRFHSVGRITRDIPQRLPRRQPADHNENLVIGFHVMVVSWQWWWPWVNTRSINFPTELFKSAYINWPIRRTIKGGLYYLHLVSVPRFTGNVIILNWQNKLKIDVNFSRIQLY